MSQLKSGNTFQEFLNWAGSFQEFSICGSSIQEFLNWAGPFREFLIWGGTFQEFLIWGWPFYENFLENCVFLACFRLQWISFWLLTLIYSEDMYIFQKDWSKTLIPAWNKGSNILHQVLKQMNALWQLFPPKFGHFFNKTILTMGINSLTDTKVKHCC